MFEKYLTRPMQSVNLRDYDPGYIESGLTKIQGKNRMRKNRNGIAKLQDKLYAHDRYSILIIFQALDAAGKDSTVKHVFRKVRLQGIRCINFYPPSKEENKHDYLWRIHKYVPERRMISLFIRSYYEDVTTTRVHPDYILKQKIPGIESIDDIKNNFWTKRFNQINDFEKMLVENGTIILKFYLNVSEAKQSKRLLKRLGRSDKHWKFSEKDIEDQNLRDKYLDAYEKAINHTTTQLAPWYIIPADDKPTARYLVA
ncbi:MAG: PPK2 family polyphosphate kinase, partial [Bacteroidota bacterium]